MSTVYEWEKKAKTNLSRLTFEDCPHNAEHVQHEKPLHRPSQRQGFTRAKDMSFDGIHMDEWKKIDEWKKHPDTKSTWISQKRRSLTKALKEFRDLNDVSEFFMKFPNQTEFYRDDVLEVFYRKKTV